MHMLLVVVCPVVPWYCCNIVKGCGQNSKNFGRPALAPCSIQLSLEPAAKSQLRFAPLAGSGHRWPVARGLSPSVQTARGSQNWHYSGSCWGRLGSFCTGCCWGCSESSRIVRSTRRRGTHARLQAWAASVLHHRILGSFLQLV